MGKNGCLCALQASSEIIDHNFGIYDNCIILGGDSMEPGDSLLNVFMQSHNLFNLIKPNTCFKGNGSCIDLILKVLTILF